MITKAGVDCNVLKKKGQCNWMFFSLLWCHCFLVLKTCTTGWSDTEPHGSQDNRDGHSHKDKPCSGNDIYGIISLSLIMLSECFVSWIFFLVLITGILLGVFNQLYFWSASLIKLFIGVFN